MNDKNRILELVRLGVISNDEAIELLENLGKNIEDVDFQNDSQIIEEIPVGEEVDTDEVQTGTYQADDTATSQNVDHDSSYEEMDRAQLETLLSDLTEKINHYSVEIDDRETQLQALKSKVAAKRERIDIINTEAQMDQLTEELKGEKLMLSDEIIGLDGQIKALSEEQEEIRRAMKDVKREKQSANYENYVHIGRDEFANASEKVSGKLNTWVEQISGILNRSVDQISKSLYENNINTDSLFEHIRRTQITHQFDLQGSGQTILDIQLAMGNVKIETSDVEKIKATFSGFVAGRFEETNEIEALLARVTTIENDEKLTLHIPNKKLQGNLTIIVPNKVYDHISVKTLHGDVQICDVEGKDFYVKVTNGNVDLVESMGTMAEIDVVSGNVRLDQGQFLDTMVKVINGNIDVNGGNDNQKIETTNGNIRMTVTNSFVKNIDADSTYGNVKIALPLNASLDGRVESKLGTVKSRLSNVNVKDFVHERSNTSYVFDRVGDSETQTITLQAKTSVGNILLKDSNI